MFWLLAAAAASAFLFYRFKQGGSTPLLRAAVSTPEGSRYSVAYEPLHPDMEPVEYVRLVLMFAAKMLHVMGSDPEQTGEKYTMLKCIRLLGEQRLSPTTDVFRLCTHRTRITVQEGPATEGGKSITAVLGFQDPVNRSIQTSIPLSRLHGQFLESWLALVQTSLPKLDPMLLDRLQGSLRRLGRMYSEERVDSSSMQALMDAPNRAFVEADVIGSL